MQPLMASSNPSERPWRAGTIFIICVCCAPECQCLLGSGSGALHRAGVLVFMSSTMVFAATAKGHPLTIRLWWPGRLAFLFFFFFFFFFEACISRSYGIVAIRKMDGCWQAATHRALHRQQTKAHPLSFCEGVLSLS